MQSEEYRKGYEQGIKDYAERVKKYYSALTGKTMTAVVRYALTIMEQEMLKEGDKKDE
jgi:DNA-binding protein Fis